MILEKIKSKIEESPFKYTAYEDMYYICVDKMQSEFNIAFSYLLELSHKIETVIPKLKKRYIIFF